MKEAMFYEPVADKKIRCSLCHQACVINPDKYGLCGVRQHRDGKLYTHVYGKAIAQAIDPIEKKPLYHFLPGSYAFSIGTRGCNFRCLHCQNADISQIQTPTGINRDPTALPGDIVSKASASDCASIAYTYNEPTIFYEYAYDTAVLGETKGLKNVFVTNGYIGEEALKKIAPKLHAANIDLKFYSDDLYGQICGAKLQPVLDNIRLYHDLGIWTEVTTLVIPGYNDDDKQLAEIAGFIADIDKNIPWHVTGFYPTYKLTDTVPTTHAMLQKALNIGQQAGLNYVYMGNVGGSSDTNCPSCGNLLIERRMGRVAANNLKTGSCPECGTKIAGIWE
ncbi:MAG: AmmeMemoRadiSam system radical SAM enzyme [Verrucomicrobiota bacterium]